MKTGKPGTNRWELSPMITKSANPVSQSVTLSAIISHLCVEICGETVMVLFPDSEPDCSSDSSSPADCSLISNEQI